MRCNRGKVLLLLVVLVLGTGTSALALSETISGTIPAFSDADTILAVWTNGWNKPGLLCGVGGRSLELIPNPDPSVEFLLHVDVPGGTTTTPHSYQLDVTYDESAEAFTLVELTIGATTTDVTDPGLYSFPEIDIVSNRVPLARGIPALGRWATIGTVGGLVLLGAGLVLRRGL